MIFFPSFLKSKDEALRQKNMEVKREFKGSNIHEGLKILSTTLIQILKRTDVWEVFDS